MNEDKMIEVPRRIYLELIGENNDLKEQLVENAQVIENLLKLPQSRVEKLRDIKYVQTLRQGFHKVAELNKTIKKLEAKIYAQKKLIEELTAY